MPGMRPKNQVGIVEDDSAYAKRSEQIASVVSSTNSKGSQSFIRPSAKVEKLIQNLRQEQVSGSEEDRNSTKKR